MRKPDDRPPLASKSKLDLCAALCALLGTLAEPVEASLLLDRAHLPSAFSNMPDLVTGYTTEMARYRLQLMAPHSAPTVATALAPMHLRPEFRKWAWRAADGSLLQGFAGKGGFRLTLGNCLAVLCSAQECIEAEWPVFTCSDGRKRKMVVKDFTTAVFDGVTYRRLSARAAAPGHGG